MNPSGGCGVSWRDLRVWQGLGTLLCVGLLIRPANAESCQLKQVADLSSSFPDGRPVIDVSVNGAKAKFLLATSSEPTQIRRGFAERLGLGITRSQMRTSSAEGTNSPDSVQISEFQIGQMVANYGRIIVDDSEKNKHTDGIDGVVGLDYLSNIIIELDPAEHKVRLFSDSDCNNIVYWWSDYFEIPISIRDKLPSARIKIDDNEVEAYIATGASQSVIDIGVAKARLNVGDISAPPNSHMPDHDNTDSDPIYTFRDLGFGPIKLRNPKFALHRYAMLEVSGASHIHETVATDVPAIIGMDVLGKFHSIISVRRGKIDFTLPNERTPPVAKPPS